MKNFISVTERTTTNQKYIFSLFFFVAILYLNCIKCFANDTLHDGYKPCETCTSEIMESNLKEYCGISVTLEGIELQSTQLINSFYAQNDYRPAWTDNDGQTAQAKELVNLFINSYNYGIEPSLLNVYEINMYAELMQSETKDKKLAKYRAEFELLLTNAAFTFMLNLAHGYQFTNPLAESSAMAILNIYPEFLNKIKSSNNITCNILSVQPKNELYTGLQAEMSDVVSYIKLLENSVETNDISTDISLMEYIVGLEGIVMENNGLIGKDYLEQLIKVYQNNMLIRETGKLTLSTRKNISRVLILHYTELADQVESIRSENSMTELVALAE